ncbi:MAG: hypothetical protein ACOYJB_05380 [Christensenellaceae bacterium]|jgi:hypothetical protein
MNPLFIIIPIVVVIIIAVAGAGYARKQAAKYQSASAMQNTQPLPNGNASDAAPQKPRAEQVYEKPGVDQQSNHPLGAVQSVIRGRIRFVFFGLLFIAIALLGFYALYGTDMDLFFERTNTNMLIGTVLFIGVIVWGIWLISYATYRVKLRRTGFEVSSMFGTKSYAYKDAEFHMDRTIEHKHRSHGYRPAAVYAGDYNYIWVCQILFKDNRKSVVLKSSRYAWLSDKISDLTNALGRTAKQ